MKRFILSAVSVLLAAGALAPTAQALPKVDSAFKLQTLRLREFDARNKAEESPQPYYPQTSTPNSPKPVTAEQDSTQTTEPAEWEATETQEETASPALSILEQRHQVLDRS